MLTAHPGTRCVRAFGAALLLAHAATAQELLHSPYVTLPNPYAVDGAYVGRFDADELPDVVFSTNSGPDSDVLVVVLGGSQQLVLSPLPDGTVTNLAVGDVDGDGLDDVASYTADPPLITVLRAQGGGSFGSPVAVAPLHDLDMLRVDLGDATDDGHVDLLLSQRNHARLTLWAGDGAGGFGAPTEVKACFDARRVRFGDLDGDGHVDLAVLCLVTFSEGSVSWLRGHGGGLFDLPVEVPEVAGQGGARDIALADMFGSGHDDLVAGASNEIDILSWHAGGLQLASATPSASASDLVVADFDGNGRPDVAFTSIGSTVSVLLQQPDRSFATQPLFACTPFPNSLAAVDADLDGWLDLVSSGSVHEGFLVLRGRPQGAFAPLHGYIKAPLDVALADFDDDGRPDLLTAHGASQPLQLRLGRVFGDFAAPQPVDAGPGASRLHVVDADGDDLPDVIALAPGAAGSLTLLPNVPGHGFGVPQVIAVPQDVAAGFAVGQFVGDALPDVAVLVVPPTVFYETGIVRVLRNRGGVLAAVATYEIGDGPKSIAAGDMNADGFDDLIAGAGSPNQFQVHLALGTGSFQLLQSQNMLGEATALAVGDADGDGRLDLLEPYASNVRVHWGVGNGFVHAITQVGLPAGANQVAVADLTGDGLPDLVSANKAGVGQVEVAVAAGLGGQAFALAQGWSLGGFGGSALAVADVDLDGALDVAVALPDGQQVAVLLNGTGPWHALGHSLAGAAGESLLEGAGPLLPGSDVLLRASGASANTPALLVAGLAAGDMPFKGGVLVPAPDLIVSGLATDDAGELLLAGGWPHGVPSGTTLFLQTWFPGTAGFAATTALSATSP
jgi:FG-GAP-like repeat